MFGLLFALVAISFDDTVSIAQIRRLNKIHLVGRVKQV